MTCPSSWSRDRRTSSRPGRFVARFETLPRRPAVLQIEELMEEMALRVADAGGVSPAAGPIRRLQAGYEDFALPRTKTSC